MTYWLPSGQVLLHIEAKMCAANPTYSELLPSVPRRFGYWCPYHKARGSAGWSWIDGIEDVVEKMPLMNGVMRHIAALMVAEELRQLA